MLGRRGESLPPMIGDDVNREEPVTVRGEMSETRAQGERRVLTMKLDDYGKRCSTFGFADKLVQEVLVPINAGDVLHAPVNEDGSTLRVLRR